MGIKLAEIVKIPKKLIKKYAIKYAIAKILQDKVKQAKIANSLVSRITDI